MHLKSWSNAWNVAYNSLPACLSQLLEGHHVWLFLHGKPFIFAGFLLSSLSQCSLSEMPNLQFLLAFLAEVLRRLVFAHTCLRGVFAKSKSCLLQGSPALSEDSLA